MASALAEAFFLFVSIFGLAQKKAYKQKKKALKEPGNILVVRLQGPPRRAEGKGVTERAPGSRSSQSPGPLQTPLLERRGWTAPSMKFKIKEPKGCKGYHGKAQ